MQRIWANCCLKRLALQDPQGVSLVKRFSCITCVEIKKTLISSVLAPSLWGINMYQAEKKLDYVTDDHKLFPKRKRELWHSMKAAFLGASATN